MFLFYFAPGLSLCTNAHWILLISCNLLLMTWIADSNCVWVWICVSDLSNYFIIIIMLDSLNHFHFSHRKKKINHCFQNTNHLQRRGEWDCSCLTCTAVLWRERLMMQTVNEFHMLMCTCLNLKSNCGYLGKKTKQLIISHKLKLC